MENRAHALATGLFILLLSAALAVVVAWFQGDRSETLRYTVVSRSGVPGLNVKAAVKLQGVQVGKVEAIDFDPAEPRQILISIDVAKSAPLNSATVARLGYQGITGLSFIDMADAEGSSTAPAASRLAAGARIELRPSLIDQLSSSGPRLVEGLSEVALRLNRLLSDANQQQLTRSLGRFGAASDSVAQLSQALRPTAAALAPLAQQSNRLLSAAGTTLQRIDGLAAESSVLAQELRQRSQALDKLGLAAAQLQATTERLELALVGPNRPRSQALFDDISQGARAVERAANELGEQPQSLLFGRSPPPAGPGEAGFDAGKKGGP